MAAAAAAATAAATAAAGNETAQRQRARGAGREHRAGPPRFAPARCCLTGQISLPGRSFARRGGGRSLLGREAPSRGSHVGRVWRSRGACWEGAGGRVQVCTAPPRPGHGSSPRRATGTEASVVFPRV